jgi:hypothetical protein
VLLSYLFCTTMGKARRMHRTPLAVVANKYFGRVSPWQWSDSLPCLPLLVIPTDYYSPSMRSCFSRLVPSCVITKWKMACDSIDTAFGQSRVRKTNESPRRAIAFSHFTSPSRFTRHRLVNQPLAARTCIVFCKPAALPEWKSWSYCSFQPRPAKNSQAVP